jgi:hypothetical protein
VKFTIWEDKKCTHRMSMGKYVKKHHVGRKRILKDNIKTDLTVGLRT